jgi:Glutathione S-transferase
VIQGLDDEAAPPGNGHALREQFGERVRVIDLPRAGHFLCWSSPKPLPAPSPSLSALAQYLADGLREIERSRNGALRRHICATANGSSQIEAILMTDIILHHYETSPYSEKVRLGLGLKGLAWASVEIPVSCRSPT